MRPRVPARDAPERVCADPTSGVPRTVPRQAAARPHAPLAGLPGEARCCSRPPSTPPFGRQATDTAAARPSSFARGYRGGVRIFSGIQPTGRKHLGNYIGAIAQYVEGQDRGDPAIYCIVDLHAITVRYDPAELRERLYDTAAILIAAGLDPERCILFRQGDVPEHTELCWLLASVTAIGELNRMHQFRDKSAAQRELVSSGLLYYPVLQAADVLLYRTDEVPVGEDQREHLELTRDVAVRFNARYGDVLVVPEHRIPEVGARVRDLQEPERKMSTTGGSEQGTVHVLDEPIAVVKKFKRAVTDSADPPTSRVRSEERRVGKECRSR